MKITRCSYWSRTQHLYARLRHFLLFTIVLLYIFEAVILFSFSETNPALPPLFGNFPAIQTSLEKTPPKDEFSFAVYGDTKGVSGTYQQLVGILRDHPVDFSFLMGDAFWGDTYKFFRGELAEEYTLPFPTFFVAGNHDIETLSLPSFEKTFGPSIFSFEYQHCLFIVLRIIGETASDQKSIDFLKELSRHNKKPYRKIFVFMHIPPPILPLPKFNGPPELIPVFQDMKVDYVFSGHYHGYCHMSQDDTTYIVTGGTGNKLEESTYTQFRHGVVITVDQDYVRETIIALPEQRYNVPDALERFILVDGYSWIDNNIRLVYTLNIILFTLTFGAYYVSLKKRLHL